MVLRQFPNKNIESLLNSTRQITFEHEIILVIGCSVDDSASAEMYFRQLLSSNTNLVEVRIVELTSDEGPAFGRNLGAVLANSANLAFLDDDVVLLDDIEPLLNLLEENLCQGVQPLLLRSADQRIVDSAGDFIRKGKNLFYTAYSKGYGDPLDKLGPLCVEELPSLRGAFMMIRKDPLLHVGGLDNKFNFNFEDVDLSWRMVIAGYKLLFLPTVRALHKGGRTTDSKLQDDQTVMLGLVNYHATHLKVMGYLLWPYILARFFDRLLRHEVSKLRKREISADEFIREIASTFNCLLGKIGWVNFHKRILGKEFGFRGIWKLESMANGKRFVLSSAKSN